MKKSTISQIENNMSFLLGDKLKICLANEDAIAHLSKAKNLLDNAGLFKKASMVCDVMDKVIKIDDQDIEVKL